MRCRMKLSCLRAFVAAAQYGSFTRAAEHLFLSQSALSRQIRELETELGVRLFERDNKKEPRLSAEGQLLLANAMEIVESCDRFPRLVSGSGGKGNGVCGRISSMLSFLPVRPLRRWRACPFCPS